MMMVGRWMRVALGVVGVAAAALGCGRESTPTADEGRIAPSVAVRLARLEMRTFVPRVEAPGRWRLSGEFHVVAPFPAIVESLGARVGDGVARGQRIGWLVTRESQAAIRGAELLMHQAQDPAARDEATRALTLARRDVVRVPLVAATSGTVSQRSAEPGAEVPEGAELLTLVPQGALVFEAHVPPGQAARVAGGQPAHVAMEDGTSLAALVRARVPANGAADQTVLVWLTPRAPARPEFLERFGVASIEVGVGRRALAVPDSAVVEDDLTGERRVAFVDSTGLAVWRTVELGSGGEGWHELMHPLSPTGTRVVVNGQRGLPDSTHVRIER
jgi:biotin carboxyl carrier protein